LTLDLDFEFRITETNMELFYQYFDIKVMALGDESLFIAAVGVDGCYL